MQKRELKLSRPKNRGAARIKSKAQARVVRFMEMRMGYTLARYPDAL